MREYNEFFRFAPHAFLTTYVVYMAGIFDKSKGTISLIHLLSETRKSGKLKPIDAAEIDALLAQAKPIADKITTLRHKAFAHRSANTSYNDAFKEAAVTPDELRELTDTALTVANRLLRAHGLSHQYFTDLPHKAAQAMMEALSSHDCHKH